MSELNIKSKYVVDKMPQNFYFLPFIVRAFPNAKIIHMNRDPAATCWSNFKQYFSGKQLGYSYDLVDLELYYEQYNRLMKTWYTYYGDHMYRCELDLLTDNFEVEVNNLFQALGLSAESSCFNLDRKNRTVQTASKISVRGGVHRSDRDSWKNYRPYLKNAFDTLQDIEI